MFCGEWRSCFSPIAAYLFVPSTFVSGRKASGCGELHSHHTSRIIHIGQLLVCRQGQWAAPTFPVVVHPRWVGQTLSCTGEEFHPRYATFSRYGFESRFSRLCKAFLLRLLLLRIYGIPCGLRAVASCSMLQSMTTPLHALPLPCPWCLARRAAHREVSVCPPSLWVCTVEWEVRYLSARPLCPKKQNCTRPRREPLVSTTTASLSPARSGRGDDCLLLAHPANNDKPGKVHRVTLSLPTGDEPIKRSSLYAGVTATIADGRYSSTHLWFVLLWCLTLPVSSRKTAHLSTKLELILRSSFIHGATCRRVPG